MSTADVTPILAARGVCSVCAHPRVTAIDEALSTGTPVRQVAETYALSRSALSRHRLNHSTLQGVSEELERSQNGRYAPIEVHGALTSLAARLDALLKVNARTPARATSLSNLAREYRQTLEAIARLQADERLLRAAQLEGAVEQFRSGEAEMVMGALKSVMQQYVGHPHTDLAKAIQASVNRHMERLKWDHAHPDEDDRSASRPEVEGPFKEWNAKRLAALAAEESATRRRFADELAAALKAQRHEAESAAKAVQVLCAPVPPVPAVPAVQYEPLPPRGPVPRDLAYSGYVDEKGNQTSPPDTSGHPVYPTRVVGP